MHQFLLRGGYINVTETSFHLLLEQTIVISVNAEITNYTWKDSKNNVYPIYITSNGSCFIYRISNKTGKEYKQYMKVEISQQICTELGREYKGKRKS